MSLPPEASALLTDRKRIEATPLPEAEGVVMDTAADAVKRTSLIHHVVCAPTAGFLAAPRARIAEETSMSAPRLRPITVLLALVTLLAMLLAGCGGSSASSSGDKITAVGAENEYANVIEQIGGKYVDASAIESNPNTDPHSFEASPSVAQEVSDAELVIQNGVGYDDYMEKIESASPSSSRKVINVQKLLGLPNSTPNPHLWYKPETMPAVAKALVSDFSALQPNHRAYFTENAKKFNQSLKPWLAGLSRFSSRYPNSAVATTEPVSDYMLEAAGVKNLTPFSMQADIMNGTDPAPQDVALRKASSPPHGRGLHLQPAGDRLGHRDLPQAPPNTTFPWSASTRRCHPGFDYQSGCWQS